MKDYGEIRRVLIKKNRKELQIYLHRIGYGRRR